MAMVLTFLFFQGNRIMISGSPWLFLRRPIPLPTDIHPLPSWMTLPYSETMNSGNASAGATPWGNFLPVVARAGNLKLAEMSGNEWKCTGKRQFYPGPPSWLLTGESPPKSAILRQNLGFRPHVGAKNRHDAPQRDCPAYFSDTDAR